MPFVDISDSTQAPQGSLLKITIANFFATVPTPIIVTAGTVTVSTPVFQATETWNAGGVTFTGFSLSITDAASAAGSYLMMLRVGGSEKFSVNKAGVAQAVSQFKGIGTGLGSASAFLASTGAGYGWTDAGAGADGKNWGMMASGTTLTLSAYSDANGSASPFLSFTRSGNSAVSVDLSVQLNAPTAVIGLAGAASTFTIGNAAPAADATGSLKFLNSNTNLNWQIQATNGTLTVTPSTAGGGSTFTTPLLTFASATVTLATGSTLAAKAVTFTTSITSSTALATPSALAATGRVSFASTVSGAAIMGYGTTNDVSLMNRAGTVCLGIGPNTTVVNIPGSLTVSGTSALGAVTSSSNFTVFRDGSDIANLGAYITLSNAANTRNMWLQLNGANGMDFWTYNAGSTKIGTLTSAGALSVIAGISATTGTFSGNVVATTAGATTLSILSTTSANPYLKIGNVHRNIYQVLVDTGSDATLNFSDSTDGSSPALSWNVATGLVSFGYAIAAGTAVVPSASVAGIYLSGQSSGNLSSSGASTSAYNHWLFLNGNGTVGSISTSGTATTYATSSDARLKVDLGIARDVDVLRGLIVHDFDWKVNGQRDRGVFAQEAYCVKPSAVVVGEGDRPWQVDYSKFVPDLIVGWQNHESRLASLEARLA